MICIGKYWNLDQDNPRFTVPGLLFRVLLFRICCSVFYHSGFKVPYSSVPRSGVPCFTTTRNTGTRNNGTRNTGGTAEHPGTVAEQLYITPEDQWNTAEQRNHTKRRTIVAFLRGSLNSKFKLPTQAWKLFIADINYLFVSLYLRLVYT